MTDLKDELPEKANTILNGHNEQVNKLEDPLSEKLMEMITDMKNKSGEEAAGIMNYYFMEITDLMRKAGAIGYIEGLHDLKEGKE